MDSRQKIKLKSLAFIALVHTLANGLIVLNRGSWWDNFRLSVLLAENNMHGVFVHLAQFRSYALYTFIEFIASLGGNTMAIFKITSFVLWLVSALLLYVILRKVSGLPERTSIFIASLFVVFPSFPFKGEFGYTVFALGPLFFFAGILIYFISADEQRAPLKYFGYVSATVVFFASFWNNAILVLYGGFLFHLLYRRLQPFPIRIREATSRTLAFIKTQFVFIVLPIIFWLYRASMGKPYGEVGEGYTKLVIFEPGFFKMFVDNAWSFISYGFLWPFSSSLAILERRLFVILIVIILAALGIAATFVFRKTERDETKTEPSPRMYFAAGLLWFFLGAFPYIAVNQYLSVFGDGFHMRYGILIPLGAALIIVSMLHGTLKERAILPVQIFIIALFATHGVFNMFLLDMDWYRQTAIVESLKHTSYQEIKDASALVFHNTYREMEYRGRNVKSGEYIVYLHLAFPDQFKTALAADVGDINPGQTQNDAIKYHYNRFKNYGGFPTPDGFNPLQKIVDITVTSTNNEENQTVKKWLTLKKSEMFGTRAEFLVALDKTFGIAVAPFVPERILLEKK